MTELPPNLSALLDRARVDHDPSDADRERVLRALTTSLALGGAATMLAQAPAAGAQMAATTSVLPTASSAGGAVAKWWLIASLAAGVGAGTWTAWPENALPAQGETSPAPIAAQAPTLPNVSAHGEQVAEGVNTKAPERDGVAIKARDLLPTPAAEPSLAAEPMAEPRPRAKDAPSRRALAPQQARVNHAPSTQAATAEPDEPVARVAPGAAMPSEPATASAATRPSNHRELTLIRRALTALRDGQPTDALALLAEHARRFPSGALADQRAGLRVVALCEAGQGAQGAREQRAFLAQDSSSALAQRVRQACAPGSTP